MFDIIIVGAGSAGCVLANRLSHGGATKVLLLEAGGADDKSEVKIPAAFSKLFHTDADWDFATEPEAGVDRRQLYWPRGKMLGGSSSLNAMMYVRGHRSDYDQWRQLGNAGWGYDDVLPYFKRSEGFAGRSAAAGFHGTEGPVTISDQRSPHAMTAAMPA
jgi:choline dehydrogenase